MCVDEGVVYADELPEEDAAGFQVLSRYCRKQRPETDPLTIDAGTELRLLPRAEFVRHVLVPLIEDPHAAVCGFNLAFDLSRVAVIVESARRSSRKKRLDMFQGGFSLALQSYRTKDGEERIASP